MVRISTTASNLPLRPVGAPDPQVVPPQSPGKPVPAPLERPSAHQPTPPVVPKAPPVEERGVTDPDDRFAGLVSEVQALNHQLGIYRELPADVVAQAYYWGESLFVDTKV
jgi:hypothetical protein